MDTTRLSGLAISDSGFIFDPGTGSTFTANEIGLKVIQKFKEGHDVTDICTEIVDEYEVSFEQAEIDVMDFVRKLKSYNLITIQE
jgi:N-acetylglucosamine kinase-like BadF-type ATPase